jgi:dipeptidyl aminopeptidase/acylaminoacyl peptidase
VPKAIARYGSWKSPITSDLIVADAVSLSEAFATPDAFYWLEGRPKEDGRTVIVRRRAGEGKGTDILPAPFSARTRVHEYGGGAWTVSGDTLFFSNDGGDDRRLYRLRLHDAAPVPLTEAGPWRYADGIVDISRNRWIGVREDHRTEPPINSLVTIDLSSVGPGEPLAEGNDFYASPRLSPDGRRLAWITWNLHAMPWNGSKLAIAEIAPDGRLRPEAIIAGGDHESVMQPEWLPDGSGLIFVSDRSDWWNLYRYDLNSAKTAPLWPLEAEFGQPLFILGMSSYALVGEDRIVCSLIRKGLAQLAELNIRTGNNRIIATPYTEIGALRAAGNRVVFRGGASDLPTSVVALDLDSDGMEVIARATAMLDDLKLNQCVSGGRPIEFKTSGGHTAHGFYYPPSNPCFEAPADEKPPLLVRCHGGPTAAASSALDLRIQYWTSRGVAFLDLNYRGSTGFGRAYRDQLHGAWGEVDVDDAEAGARHLADEGLVDSARMAITGGSAGGFTVLSTLAFRHVFAGGASYYGVSDLARLARDTHKFEARYLDWLIAPYPGGEEVYSARSPVEHAERISVPVIFFQGDEDKVVPKDQTERMVAALRARGVPAGYLLFSGEQHGFRKAESIKRALDAELYFYAANVFKINLVF